VTPEQASAFGMPPGAGLQITDLSGPKKAALEDYVEGRSVTVGVASAPGRDEAPPVEAALEQARRLLAKADEEALYAAVGLSPETPTAKVRTELEALADRFKSSMPHAKPPQAARLQAALTVLERLGRVLVNPEARLEYDFRAGHVRAPTRIVAAAERQGPDLATLRRVWNRVHPDKVDEAARLTRKAFAARQEHDLDVAVRYGRRALEMNPFFEELRKTVDAWQRNLSDAKARPQRRPKGASSAR